MTPNFLCLKPSLDALELPWKFGDNRPTRSRVMSGQTDKQTDRQSALCRPIDTDIDIDIDRFFLIKCDLFVILMQ